MAGAQPYENASFERLTLELCAQIAPCSLSDFVAIAVHRGLPGYNLVAALKQLVDRGLIAIDLKGRVALAAEGFAALGRAPEPTMEEILNSIHQVLSEDGAKAEQQGRSPSSEDDDDRADLVEGEADDKTIQHIARVLSGGAPDVVDEPVEEDILDLVAELGGLPDGAPAAQRKLSDSEEAGLALEHAIASLRAGHLSTRPRR
jgi:hypothetical protein